LHKVIALIRLLKEGNLAIIINLFWAYFYNIIILTISTGAFYALDIIVPPVWGVIAMGLSTLLVVGLSHLLTLYEYDKSLKQKTTAIIETSKEADLESDQKEE
jgi:cation transport ATPase